MSGNRTIGSGSSQQGVVPQAPTDPMHQPQVAPQRPQVPVDRVDDEQRAKGEDAGKQAMVLEMPAGMVLQERYGGAKPLDAAKLASGASLKDALTEHYDRVLEKHHASLPASDWLDAGKLKAVATKTVGGKDVAGEMARLQGSIAAYANPDFAFLNDMDKALVIGALCSVATPAGAAALKRFHLPRTLYGDKGKAGSHLAYSVEREGSNTKIWDWYGPENGTLKAEWMTDDFVARLHEHVEARALPANGGRRSPSDRKQWAAKNLTWTDLSLDGRQAYLKSEKTFRPGKLGLEPLRRMPGAPSHMTETLKWEVGGDLTVWETMTQESYSSLDQVYRAMEQLGDHLGPGGFHVHVTFEPSSRIKRLGPQDAKRFTGLLQMLDLSIFATNAPISRQPFTHTFLKVFNHSELGTAEQALGSAVGQPQKFHMIGLRHGLYKPETVVGFEIRGHLSDPKNAGKSVQTWGATAELLSDALATGTFGNVTFDAEAAFQFPNSTEATTRLFAAQAPRGSKADEAAFKLLFDNATLHGKSFDYRAAAPLLRWETLPWLQGVPPERVAAVRDNLAKARTKLMADVSKLAANAKRAKDSVWRRRPDWAEIGKQLDKQLKAAMHIVMHGPPKDAGLQSFMIAYLDALATRARED